MRAGDGDVAGDVARDVAGDGVTGTDESRDPNADSCDARSSAVSAHPRTFAAAPAIGITIKRRNKK